MATHYKKPTVKLTNGTDANVLDTSDIVQATGTATDKVMSQNAVKSSVDNLTTTKVTKSGDTMTGQLKITTTGYPLVLSSPAVETVLQFNNTSSNTNWLIGNGLGSQTGDFVIWDSGMSTNALISKRNSNNLHIRGTIFSNDNKQVAILDSPTFTGTPSAPNPASTDSSTRIATTQYVNTNFQRRYVELSSLGLSDSSFSNDNLSTALIRIRNALPSWAEVQHEFAGSGDWSIFQSKVFPKVIDLISTGYQRVFTMRKYAGNNTFECHLTFHKIDSVNGIQSFSGIGYNNLFRGWKTDYPIELGSFNKTTNSYLNLINFQTAGLTHLQVEAFATSVDGTDNKWDYNVTSEVRVPFVLPNQNSVNMLIFQAGNPEYYMSYIVYADSIYFQSFNRYTSTSGVTSSIQHAVNITVRGIMK